MTIRERAKARAQKRKATPPKRRKPPNEPSAVESGVPIPEKKSTINGKPRRYPFSTMEVGDSFFVKQVKGYPMTSLHRNVSGQASRRAAAHEDEKYTTRQVEGGVRVWRTS